MSVLGGGSGIRTEHEVEEPYPRRLHFRNVVENQNIVLGEVEAILQDHQGFMWLGGRNSLLRYDGYDFIAIPIIRGANTATANPILNQVLDLIEDSQQRLWVASRSGLYRYDRDREVLLPVTSRTDFQLFNIAVNSIVEAPNGDLIAGTANGLIRITPSHDPNDLSTSRNIGLLPNNLVNDVVMDNDKGYYWLATGAGLVRMNIGDERIAVYSPRPNNPNSVLENSLRTIAIDKKGRIWCGSDNGIYRFDPATRTFTHYQHDPADPESLGNNFFRELFVDSNGWVWAGSDGAGLNLYDETNDQWIRFIRNDGSVDLPSNVIRRVYEDKSGDLWVGTYPSGASIFDHSTRSIRNYRKSPRANLGPMDNNVESLVEDSAGNLWIGANGISRFNAVNDTFTHYTAPPENNPRVGTAAILKGLEDSTGQLLFGSWGGGIQRYNRDKDRFDPLPVDPDQSGLVTTTGDSVNDLMVWSIFEDTHKDLWIATHNRGLTKYDRRSGKYHFYPPVEGDLTTISANVVWSAFEDSAGNLWVGTANGLNLMNRERGTFKRYPPNPTNPHGLANGSVPAILQDSSGNLWFGTDAGLHLHNSDTDDFTVFDTRHGIADDGIRVIVEDRYGWLWLGTNNGITRFNPSTFEVKNFTRFNGKTIGGVSNGAALVTKAGLVAFGTRTGLYLFDPSQLDSVNPSSPIVLTDFRLFTNKVYVGDGSDILSSAINQTHSITVNHRQSMISFGFSALNFRTPEQVEYAYKLVGYDDEWRHVGTQRSAIYTNLPSGQYHFYVRARIGDDTWEQPSRSVTLTVLPPPWKTWWAYTGYLLLCLLALAGFLYRQNQKIARARYRSHQLEIEVGKRTAELKRKNQELELAYSQLEEISLSEPLTGLNNRRYLQKTIPMAVAKIQRDILQSTIDSTPINKCMDLTFFILDIDHFKSVNDLYGHNAGDQLLIQIAELLKNICRESDCIVRWGGEEFLIISSEPDEAHAMAERIRQSIETNDFVLPDGRPLKKTCSLGFASYPFVKTNPFAVTWEQVIDVADSALYAAKKSGRNMSVGIAAQNVIEEHSLYERICDDIEQLIQTGELQVITYSSKRLVWADTIA